MSSSGDTISHSIVSPFSPVFWAYTVSLLLLGASVMQGYTYFLGARDRLPVKILAGIMLAFNVADSALVAASVYYYLIPHFGSVSHLATATREMATQCMTATIITTLSQMYFVYQLIGAKRLGKGSWSVVIAISVFLIVALGASIACVVAMALNRDNLTGKGRNMFFEISFGVSKASASVADIMASVAMCLFLTSVKTSMNQTNSILTALMKVIVNRAVLVTIIQVLLLVTFYASPSTIIWMAFHIILPKLYVNTYFAMLNGRDILKERHLSKAIVYNDPESASNKTRTIHPASTNQSTLLSNGQKKFSYNDSTLRISSIVASDVPHGQ